MGAESLLSPRVTAEATAFPAALAHLWGTDAPCWASSPLNLVTSPPFHLLLPPPREEAINTMWAESTVIFSFSEGSVGALRKSPESPSPKAQHLQLLRPKQDGNPGLLLLVPDDPGRGPEPCLVFSPCFPGICSLAGREEW